MGVSVRYFHGTQHPYEPGDLVVGGQVDPNPGEGYDPRTMVWAVSDADAARRWAARVCMCGHQADGAHRPRVFEVVLDDPIEDDVNDRGAGTLRAASVMAPGARIIAEVEPPGRSTGPSRSA